MQIIVNASSNDVSSSTLDAVLEELGFTSPAIATAVNGQFVAATARPATTLAEGDRLEVVSPMQGG